MARMAVNPALGTTVTYASTANATTTTAVAPQETWCEISAHHVAPTALNRMRDHAGTPLFAVCGDCLNLMLRARSDERRAYYWVQRLIDALRTPYTYREIDTLIEQANDACTARP